MNRKEFISTTALSVIALTVFGKISKNKKGVSSSSCSTTNDILGPFYRPNAPLRNNLIFEGLQGTAIELIGVVYAPDCKTPMPNALVEIWHCNTAGEYDNDSKDFNLRASWKTNANGEYNFKTILPGKYLNGALYRPAHIHYRVTAKGQKELVSQLYFKGDPHITQDPWASQEKAKLRIAEIAPTTLNGGLSITFNIFMG